MIKQELTKIIANKKIAGGFFKLTIASTSIAKAIAPGQFINLRIPNSNIPFLRKPFSVYEKSDKTISILYKIIGQGTTKMAALKAGESIDILGPLGKAAKIPNSKNKIALVAGGVGIASLKLLAEAYPQKPDLFYGVKSKNELLEIAKWKPLTKNIFLCSDDGSVGKKEFVTDLFKEKAQNYDVIYTCGPKIMLQKIAQICQKFKIKHYLIMEEYMACGYGVCMGCVVQTKTGNKRVCTDGPVFDGDDIL